MQQGGEAPSTTARRQQIRLAGPEVWGVCCVAAQPKATKRQTSEGRAGYGAAGSSTSCPPETGPSSIKGKVSIQKSTMTQRKLGETVNGESPPNHSLNGRAGPSCNRQPLVALALLIKEPEAGKLTNPSLTAPCQSQNHRSKAFCLYSFNRLQTFSRFSFF